MTKDFAGKRSKGLLLRAVQGMVLVVLGAFLLSSASVCRAAVNPESTGYYNDAQAYIKKGDLNAAVIQLKNAIRADESNVDARFDLAKIYLAALNGAGAEKELRAALAHGMSRERMLLPLAQALILQNNAEALLKEIDPDIVHGHDAAVLHAVRARAHLMRKQFDQAEQEIDKALAIEPQSGPALVTRSQLLQNRGKLAEAEQAVDFALAASPNLTEALIQKGTVRQAQGDFKQALEAFDRALASDTGNVSALLGRAGSRLSLGKTEQARQDVDTVLRRQPDNPAAGFFDAFFLGRAAKYQEAIERLQHTRGLEDYAPALYLSGSLNFMVGNLDRARESAERYVARVPESVPGQTLLAAVLLRQSEPKKAIEHLQPIVTSASEDFNAISLLATAYMMDKQTAKAAELYGRALELHPENVAVRLQLARTYLGAGDKKQAVSELERVIAETPDATAASALLIVTLASDRQLDEADKAARAFREKAHDKPLPLYLLGYIALSRNDLAAARAQFEQALQVDPDFVAAALSLAALDQQSGRLADAKRRYEEVISRAPNNVPARLALAQLALNESDANAALSWLDKATAADPKDLRPLIAKVDVLLAKGQTAPALLAARELQTRAPDNQTALDVLGRVQLAAGEQADAISTYRRLVATAPDSAAAQYKLGQVLRQAGKLEEAAGALDAATAIAPNMLDAWRARADIKRHVEGIVAARALAASLGDRIGPTEAHALEGDLLFAEGQYAEAAKLYRAAYDEKASSRIVRSLSSALMQAGQSTQALSVLTDWLTAHPDDNEARFALSAAYIQTGQLDAALSEGERVLSTAPNLAANLNNLAWLYDQKGDTEKALGLARRAYELAPKSPEIADTLGWLLVRQSDTSAAMPLLDQAWKGAPDNPAIGYHYAWALAKDGKSSQAAEIISKALQSPNKFAERKDAEQLGATLKTP